MSTPENTLAPETLNREQDDESAQAQTVASEAQQADLASPLDSEKYGESEVMGDTSQDIVDHMRDMESSGRIDMGAYDGEPNMDDNAGKYGAGHEAEFEGDDS